ncbi:type I polyketide synthase [Xylanibacillus composti]|uniref:Acyl transferase domain-containing protein n=1 Tax=Xylanibacillus composti TaxID=1572762 RepID=A0A8J4M0U8_9BACL|nr:type I polyketide synthase [Xylanibacillus composti]GIQ67177.1 hypothetical protein XYCOK13_00010 [Xylanibacillus composti]
MNIGRDYRMSSLLDRWAETQPNKRALVFLENGSDESESLTYAELRTRARAAALQLRERRLTGERVLLLFPSGIDYVVSFLACMYAGVIAIPVYPPRNNYHAERVAIIARDSGARTALAPDHLRQDIHARISRFADISVQVMALEDFDLTGPGWTNEEVAADDVSYLQYTSGSTGNPKGVMVRHQDPIRNCEIVAPFGLHEGIVIVSWLPLFHDLGLVKGILYPLILGGTAVFMPPIAFVDKPIRWLQALDRYKGEFSCAPNFAYDLCVRKVSEEEAKQLDLSSWSVALNGAEPISIDTMRAFVNKFRASSFAENAWVGGYGMAESTLFATFGKNDQATRVLYLDRPALELDHVVIRDEHAGNVQAFVSCGYLLDDPQIRIVDPKSGKACPPDRIGEIWIAGSCVCPGYWNRPDATAETFGIELLDEPGVRYLRSGDLGFIHEGELYMTGRLKDMIIIRGANHYPQDIERTAASVSDELRQGGWGIAFDVTDGGEQKLIVVQEVERTARKRIDVGKTGRAMAQAISECHGIDLDTVVFVPPGKVPKTSSGKLQRRACKKMFEQGELEEIGRWQRPAAAAAGARPHAEQKAIAPGEMVDWMRNLLAAWTGIPLAEMSPNQSFSSLGLGSVQVVEMIAEIGHAFDLSLPPSLAFEYPTISSLAEYLSGSVKELASDGGEFEPVAIIGLDCRFPDAEDPRQFWELLMENREAVREVSEQRRERTGYKAEAHAPFRWGGFLENIDLFDAALFNITPREAASMDPQQRLLLETAWRALESAYIAPDRLSGSSTGVFVGISTHDYFRLQHEAGGHGDPYAGTGNAFSIAANRISYVFGLQGPSMAIDTACSSSLVAVHQACRSLASGECSLALAGGVNLVLSSDYGEIFTQAGMLSPTGKCHTFDEAADGYVRGEGVGIIVLKRLSDAIRDQDQVLAVIRGSAVNQDGYSNGLTAPNGLSQQRVVGSALKRAGIEGSTIGYVETHGTGTPLGDPIEVRSLQAVLDRDTNGEPAPCWLGAVKTNIGHLESSAGIAGLIKAVLVLQNGVIPGNFHFNKLNPQIDLAESRLRIPDEAVPWPVPEHHPRRAGVSSFGFGGTNAHVIVEQYVPDPAEARDAAQLSDPGRGYLLALSAQSEASLLELANQYAACIEQPDANRRLYALCRTANQSRAQLPERLAVAGESAGEILHALIQAANDDGKKGGTIRGRANPSPKTAFLFTGQGSQYAGMGRRLYASESVFRSVIDRCDEVLTPILEVSLRAIMFGERTELLQETQYAQPAIVALEIALAEQWRYWGIEPAYAVGHSVGEYAAAYVAGLMDMETVLRLVAMRGRLMDSVEEAGRMISVNCGESEAREILANYWGQLDLAAVNAPDQVVLSGSVDLVQRVVSLLRAHGLDVAELQVNRAFHSRHMDPILDPFLQECRRFQFGSPSVKLISTGGSANRSLADASYWADQIRLPVRFADAVDKLKEEGANLFLELGPTAVLAGLGRRSLPGGRWVTSLRRDTDDCVQLKRAAAEVFVHGAQVHFKRMDEDVVVPRAALPAYPFDRKAYWFEQRAKTRADVAGKQTSFCGWRIDVAAADWIVFETHLSGPSNRHLLDHQVGGRSIMPAAGSISLAIDAAIEAQIVPEGAAVRLDNFSFYRPMDLTDRTMRIQTILRRADKNKQLWQIEIMGRRDEHRDWEAYASGTLEPVQALEQRTDMLELSGYVRQEADAAAFYARWATRDMSYAGKFRAIASLEQSGKQASAWLDVPDDGEYAGLLHAIVMDAAFQTLGQLLLDHDDRNRVPLPAGIGSLTVHKWLTGRMHVTTSLQEVSESGAIADLWIRTESGELAAQATGLQTIWANAKDAAAMEQKKDVPCWVPVWTEMEQSPVNSAVVQEAAGSGSVWIFYPPEAEQLKRAIAQQYSKDACRTFPLDKKTLQLSEDEWAERIADEANAVQKIYYLGGVLTGKPDIDPSLMLKHGEEAGVIGMFRLVKALARLGADQRRVVFKLVTSGVYGVLPPDNLHPHSAAISGFVRTAQREFPDWQFELTDIGLPESEEAVASLVHPLVKQRHSYPVAELALRYGKFYQRVLRELPPPAKLDQSPFKEKGTYLIIGGASGIGLELARKLAKEVQAGLALVGRSPYNDQHRALIRELEALGGKALYIEADASEPEQIRNAVANTKSRYGQLNGVIHSAVMLQDRAIAHMQEEEMRSVLAPKTVGSMNLYSAVRDESLDFLLFFSSAQSFIGNAGQANYAAACTAQDALAEWMDKRADYPIKSINWGYWGQVGVASDDYYKQRLAKQGIGSISIEEGMRVIEQALVLPARQLVAIRADERVLAEMDAERSEPAEKPAHSIALTPAEQLVHMEPGLMQEAIADGLRSMVSEVMRLKLDEPWARKQQWEQVKLSALGLDSLMAMELRSRIRAWVGADIPAHQFIGGGLVKDVLQLIRQRVLLLSLSAAERDDEVRSADGDMEELVI